MPTYSYDVSKVMDGGLNQMRFELGDVQVYDNEQSAYLADEEIVAVIEAHKTWRMAKFKLVEHILHRFAYEVDSTSGPVSFKLDERYQHWKKLYDELKKEAESAAAVPGGPSGRKRPPYFFEGMHDNHELMMRRGRKNHVPPTF